MSIVLSRHSDSGAVSGTTVRILRTVAEVEGIRSFWISLVGTRDSDIDVVLTLVRSDPSIQRPYVLVVEQDGNPISLMAGWVVRRNVPFRIGYWMIFNPIARVMTFPYGCLRGESSSAMCEMLVRTIIDGLKVGEADVALLEYLAADSSLCQCAEHVPDVLARDHFAARRYHRKRLLPKSADELYSDLSGNERSHFRRIRQKINTDFPGGVKIDKVGCENGLEAALKVVEEISKETWQSKMGVGLKIIGPLKALFQLEAQKSWLRIYTLHLDGKACAFWIGSVYNGTFYSDFLGYDPAYSRYSPGMFLLSCMMEDFSTQGVEAIDFGFSDEEYKRRLGNLAWPEISVHIFVRSLKGLTINFMRAVAFVLHEPARSMLTRTKLTERAKKIFRKLGTRKGVR